MQSTKLPKSLYDDCGNKARKFLWGNSEQKKIHKISWENATKLKEAGGLGLSLWDKQNAAFMTKLGWQLMKEKDSLGLEWCGPNIAMEDVTLIRFQGNARL